VQRGTTDAFCVSLRGDDAPSPATKSGLIPAARLGVTDLTETPSWPNLGLSDTPTIRNADVMKKLVADGSHEVQFTGH
jgi:hypothetical protein